MPCLPPKLLASVLASGLLSEGRPEGGTNSDRCFMAIGLPFSTRFPNHRISLTPCTPASRSLSLALSVSVSVSLSLSLTHTHTHTHTHTLSVGFVLWLGDGFVSAELSGRLKGFLSIFPMNHVALVQGYWPVSAWGSLQAHSDFQTSSCFLLGHGSACHFSRKPGLPRTPSTLHLPRPG